MSLFLCNSIAMAKEKKEKKKLKLETENSIADNEIEEPKSSENTIKKKKKKILNSESEKQVKEENLTVKMETLGENPENPNLMAPIVGYFPSGYDPSTRENKIRVYRNQNRSNRLELAVSPNGSRVNYVGTNYSGEAATPQLCDYAIGVLDKETKTLKIVRIAANKIFRLDPVVEVSDVPEDENVEKQQLTTAEKHEKTNTLNGMYSTKRTIRQTKKLETLRQQAGANAGHGIEGDKTANLQALGTSVGMVELNIPPYDLEATTPQTAYPLDKIIEKGEWDYLKDIFQISESGGTLTLDLFPSFVCNRMHRLADIQNETDKQIFAGILSYITHLIKFKDKHSMDGFSSAKHHKIPNMLSQKFASMFGGSESKRLSSVKIDLLISYVLILTLYADNFRSDPSDIAKDLKITVGDLKPRFELLCCKLSRENKLPVVTLPTPLKFPTIIRRKRRR